MSITITINTNNDAFKPDPFTEVARILKTLGKVMYRRYDDGTAPEYYLNENHPIRDINGNTVGSFVWDDE